MCNYMWLERILLGFTMICRMFLKYVVKAAIKEEPRDVPFYHGGG
jgi:hypothetical protein